MARTKKVLTYLGAGLLGLVLLVLLAILLLGRTGFGTAGVGERAVRFLDDRMVGDIQVGRITGGGILRGVTLHQVTVDDSTGQPFLRADSARLSYDLLTFLSGDVVLDRVELWNPTVRLERMPGDTVWNYERVFGSPEPDTTAAGAGGESLVLLEDARVHGGTVIVRIPWQPEAGEPLEPADSARLILEPAAGGLVRVMRFQGVNGELSRLLLESPSGEGMLFRAERLATRAYIWEQPLEIEQMEATVTIRDSLIAFEVDELRLPSSRASGVGRVVTADDNRFDVELDADHVALADLRWLLPELPEEGGASGRFRVQQRPGGSMLIRGRDIDVDAPGTRVRGDFGVVTGDILYFTEVDLAADPLDLDFVDQLLPGDLPVRGLMIGEVRVEGPISSLRTSGDVRLSHASGGGWSHIHWNGTVDARSGYGAHALELSFRGLDPALVARIAPDELEPDPDEPLTGSVRIRGLGSGRLNVLGWMDLPGPEGVSRVAGGVIAQDRPDDTHVDVRLSAGSFALRRLEKWVPSLRVLRGFGTGPVHVVSSGDSLTVEGSLRTRTGLITVEGLFSTADDPAQDFGFTLRGELEDVALDEVLDGMARARVTGAFTLEGRPGDPTTALTVRLDGSSFMGVPVHSGHLSGGLRDGTLLVDTLELESAAGALTARGRFGISENVQGALRVRATADRLSALAPMLAMQTDSTLLRGVSDFDGIVEGNHRGLRVHGTGRVARALVRGLAAPAAEYRLSLGWMDGSPVGGTLNVDASRASYRGRRLGALTLTGSIDSLRAGWIEASARTPFDQSYSARASFELSEDTTDVLLESVEIQDDGAHWTLSRPAHVRLADGTSRLERIELARRGGGRVMLDGIVPWGAPWARRGGDTAAAGDAALALASGPSAALVPPGAARAHTSMPSTETTPGAGPRDGRVVGLHAAAEAAPIGALVRVVSPESTLDGVLDGSVRVSGPAAAPVVSADGRIRAFRFEDVELNAVSAAVEYRERAARVQVSATRDQQQVIEAELELPGRLSFAPFRLDRLDRAMRGYVRAEAMPAALPAGLFSGVHDVSGTVTGEIGIAGTPLDVELEGELGVSDAGFTVGAANVPYRQVDGTLRVIDAQDLAVTLTGRASDGRFELAGGINFARLEDPSFELRLEADNMGLARRRDLEAAVTGYAELNGTYVRPRVTGRLRVVEGALHLDEMVREARVMSLENPLLVDAVDTSQVGVQRILRQNQNAFLRGLSLQIDMDVPSNFWVRSEDLNAEIAGAVTLDYDATAGAVALIGSVDAVRGFYTFRVPGLPVLRRFQLREGSINFVGLPGINPNLDLTAGYRAHMTNGDPLDVLAVVEGTMRSPQVRLTSDADPPISESDLASYIFFGRPTYALSQTEAQSFNWLGSGVGNNDLLQPVLQNVASASAPFLLGFASSEVEALAGDIGIDYVSISNEQLAEQVARLEAPLMGTRLEIGRYIGDEWFVAFTPQVRAPGSESSSTLAAGGRLEWRFHPTWNAELFWEDRWVQDGDPGFDRNLEQKPVLGLFLFREWGY